MRFLALLLLLAGSALRADPVDDLKAALGRLPGTGTVKAVVEFECLDRGGGSPDRAGEPGRVAACVAAGPDGLQINWSREAMEAVAREEIEHAADPERATPTRTAMESLPATAMQDYLDAAEDLARKLATAKLTEEIAESWEGQPARRLTFKLSPPMSARDRKYVKELNAVAKVWVGADGVPLAAESEVRVRGRAMVVIGFESTEKEEFRFARAGDRLVVVLHIKDSRGSGGGESGGRRTVAKLKLAGS